jgi:predicted nucleic acid-binding protein
LSFCVLDSSLALSWALPAESDVGMNVLEDILAGGALVPVLWPLEVANVLLMAERRRRISLAERSQALAWFAVLPIEIDHETPQRAWADISALAERHRLTVYDAAYLELAARHGLPLATLDQELSVAGRAAGLVVLI